MTKSRTFALITILFTLTGHFAAQVPPVEASTEIEKYLNTLAADQFSGSIVIAKNGRVLVGRGIGWADRKNKIPNGPEMVYEIGSTSKQFTAFAIVDLGAQAKLSPSSRLSDLLPNVPTDKKDITIHQLLTHTSGLEMYHDRKGPLEQIDKTEALKRIFDQKLKFKPGERYEYSNSGYTLLGLIIEKITGQEFKSYLKAMLERTAKIKVGFYGDRDWPRDTVAIGYALNAADHPYDRGTVTWGGLGAGYMMLSPADYAKWLTYLTTDPSIAKYREYLFGEYVPYTSIPKAFYGYGWVTLMKDDQKIIYHNGGDTTLGYITTVRYYPAKDVILVISANNYSSEPHALFDVKNKIEAILLK